MSKSKKKIIRDFSGIMYSTDPEFITEQPDFDGDEQIKPNQQDLRVMLDRKNRGGKAVTLVTGYRGGPEELQALTKLLKTKCGVGGAAKEGDIIIQGDFRDKIIVLLQNEGYKVKKSGG